MIKRIVTKLYRFFYFGNRKFNDYEHFLKSATNWGFQILPLNEFIKSNTEKIIGMRHDIDQSLNHSLNIAKIENQANVRATYFVLHTAKYFYTDISRKKINKKLISTLKYLQNDLGHEIGLHLDLMTIEKVYKFEPKEYLKNVLSLLRDEGIHINGVAPHGSFLIKTFRKNYDNLSRKKENSIYANPDTTFDLQEFNLAYEAYSIDHDIYYSDVRFINNKRWDLSLIDINTKNGPCKVIISIHPELWHKSKFNYYTNGLYLWLKYIFTYFIHLITYIFTK
jgi:hypothetical protein